MSFSYDLGTTVGQIRLQIADTDPDAYAFTDAELTHLHTQEGTVLKAAIAALKILIIDRARRTRRVSMTGLTIDDTAVVRSLQAALENLGGTMPTATDKYTPFPGDRGFVWPNR